MSANSVSKRSSSVAQEDLKIKPPLAGSFKSLAPPRGDESMLDVCAAIIADARAGLNGIDADELIAMCELCDDHGRDVKLFQETRPGAAPSRLLASLVAVLTMYTAELTGESPYSACNAALRSADRSKCKPYVLFIWFLMHALAKCDRYDGANVFRGVKADLSAEYPKDREVTWFQFSSCTCDIEVEQSAQFCGSSGTRTLFSIELTTGRARSITKFSIVPSEAEVLLPPNSRFKVLGQLDAGGGLVIVQMKELPPKDPIIDFDATLSSTAAPAPDLFSPAAAAGGGDAALDSELEALAQSLQLLKLGAKQACIGFAEFLYREGVVHVADLSSVSDSDALDVLVRAGMSKIQQNKVMHARAFAPPPATATAPAVSEAPSPAALYQEGQRLYGEQRFSDAAECWGRAALLQHGPSHAHLSNVLIDGRAGVAIDNKRGFELASAGAALGCAHSKGALGRCYVGGHGVAKDEARGLALGRESMAAGSCFGQYLVGRCYVLGCGGVAQDYAEAVLLHRLAADQGYAIAQNNLGRIFEEGQGVAQDYAEAVRLFRLAADQGDRAAQYNLGAMFQNGQGVAEDRAEAIRWYRLAAAQGIGSATMALWSLGA
jgi:TPR repeat protein